MPESLLPKCRADESLLADIITRKFVDHLPLYRIAEGFSRDGIIIGRRLLSQWVVAAGLALKPLYQVMKEKILTSNRLHIDESPVEIFDSPKVSQGYMWVLVGGEGDNPPLPILQLSRESQTQQCRQTPWVVLRNHPLRQVWRIRDLHPEKQERLVSLFCAHQTKVF